MHQKSPFLPFLQLKIHLWSIHKIRIGSSQALCSSKLNSDVIIIFAMVENGGIEPKIMTFSQICREIWSILSFQRCCLATKSKNTCKFVQEGDRNLKQVSIPLILHSVNTNKTLMDQNVSYFPLKLLNFRRFSAFSRFEKWHGNQILGHIRPNLVAQWVLFSYFG